jgi:hypothetical protein
MEILWVIIAAIVGMAAGLITTQLTSPGWNWKVFWAGFIPGAMSAAGWAVKQALSGDLTMDIIAAVLGGFAITAAVGAVAGLRILHNKVIAMQGQMGLNIPKK